MDNAQVAGPHVDVFNKAFEAKYKYDSKGPGVHTQYDAVMAIALAMNIATELTGPAIKDAVRRIHTAGGTVVGTGPEEFKKALELIKAGKPIRYSGATGPFEFDRQRRRDRPGAGLEDRERRDQDRSHHLDRRHAGPVQAGRELKRSA